MKRPLNRKLLDALHDHAAGDLDPAQARWVEERIARDARVRERFEEIREAHAAMLSLRRRPEPPLAPADAWSAIRSAIAEDAWRAKPVLRLEGEGTRFYRRLALAATALCAVSVGILVWNGRDAGTPVAEAPAPPTAAERGLRPYDDLVDAGRRGAMDGYEALRLLAGRTRDPGALVDYQPSDAVVPVMAERLDSR